MLDPTGYGILLRTRSDSLVRTVLLKIDLGWSTVQVDTRCQANPHISMSWSRHTAPLLQARSASPRAPASDPTLRMRTERGSRSRFSAPDGRRASRIRAHFPDGPSFLHDLTGRAEVRKICGRLLHSQRRWRSLTFSRRGAGNAGDRA